MKDIDLVILAGGKGTRIRKFIDCPKPLAKFNNLYFLDYLVQNYSIFNFKDIYILAGYKGIQFKKIYSKRRYNLKKIKIIIEKRPMDTGGALYNLKKIIKNDFILTNGDSILDIDLKKFIKKKSNKSLIEIALINKSFSKNKNKLENLSLKGKDIIIKNKSNYMNSGVYYCNKNILKKIKNEKKSLENEIIPKLIKKNKVTGQIIKNKFFLDIGTPHYFRKSSKILKNLFSKPAVFFDRDNTIIKDDGYTYKVKDLKFIRKSIEAIKFLIKKNYYIFLVTNQAGIAKGFFKEDSFFKFQEAMKFKMRKNQTFFHDIEYCPYHPKAFIKKYRKKTQLRKPGDMMIKNLENKWIINKRKSFMIGDSLSDKQTAKKSKIYFEYPKKNLLLQVKSIFKKLN